MIAYTLRIIVKNISGGSVQSWRTPDVRYFRAMMLTISWNEFLSTALFYLFIYFCFTTLQKWWHFWSDISCFICKIVKQIYVLSMPKCSPLKNFHIFFTDKFQQLYTRWMQNRGYSFKLNLCRLYDGCVDCALFSAVPTDAFVVHQRRESSSRSALLALQPIPCNQLG